MTSVDLDHLAQRARQRALEPGHPGPLAARIFGDGGPVIVLIHGLGRVATAWTALVEALEAESFEGRVVLVDNPGLGASRAVAIPGTTEAHAALVAETLDALGLADEPLHIVGLSFGGMIASALATQLGPRAASVASLAPSALETAVFRVTPRALWVNLKGMLPGQKLGEEVFLPLVTSAATRSRHPDLPRELEQLQRDAGGGGVKAATRQLIAATRFRLRPHRNHQPARRAVVVGTEDALVSPRNSRRYARIIDAPLFEIQGSGHDLGFDAPCPLSRWLIAWVAGEDEIALRRTLEP